MDSTAFGILFVLLLVSTPYISTQGNVFKTNNPVRSRPGYNDTKTASQNIEQGVESHKPSTIDDGNGVRTKQFGLQSMLTTLSCPQMCECYGDELTVNCSSRNLTTVPPLPLTSRHVMLQMNRISSLNYSSFEGLERLLTLDISSNLIQSLSCCAFAPLISLELLDLSNNSLSDMATTLFEPLAILTTLNISRNSLSTLSGQYFKKLVNVKILDLSYNRLNQIQNGTFQGLQSLAYLSLEINQLRYIPSTFELYAFDGLSSLKTLRLHGNQHDFQDNFTYPDQALSLLKDLRFLSLDGHPCPLGPGFKSLSYLSFLVFDQVGSTCNMQSTMLPETFFSNINTSRALNISLANCNISIIPPDVFKYTPTINRLNIDNNVYLHFDGFEKGSLGLKDSNLTDLSISNITDDRFEHCGSSITNTTFRNLQNTKLKKLTARRNYLLSINLNALRDVSRHLEHLDLEYNELDFYTVPKLLILRNVRVLKISYQNPNISPSLPKDGITTRESLKNKDDVRNNSAALLRYDNPYQNAIVRTEFMVLSKNVEEVYVEQVTEVYCNYFEIKVCNDVVLRVFDFSGNRLQSITGPISGVPSLQYLDISNNELSELGNSTLSQMHNLKTLVANKNKLGQCLADDVQGLIFSHLSNLEILDLSSNAIKLLSHTAFSYNNNLRNLTLANNDLNNFGCSLLNNTKLEVLDLSTNTLAELSSSTCEELKIIKMLSPKFQVLIANNEFVCDCRNLDFLILLVEHPEIFGDIESFTCTYQTGEHLQYSKLAKFLCPFARSCLIKVWFDVVLAVFFLVLMAGGILAVHQYKRWNVRYLYFLGKTKLHIGAIHFIEQRQKDAFVTYSQEDEVCRWLMRYKILPKLDEFGLSVVFGETDFVGQPITSCSASAVANTRKTLVVFSKDMFEDKDREFEVNFAIMHELYMRKPIVVPVLFLGADEDELENLGKSLDMSQDQARNTNNMTGNRHYARLASDPSDVEFQPWLESLLSWGLDGLTEEHLLLYEEMLASFPPEISAYIQGQGHRCIVYDGGSHDFWAGLQYSLLQECYT